MDETFMIIIVWSNEVLEEDGARVALQQLGPLDDKAVAQRIEQSTRKRQGLYARKRLHVHQLAVHLDAQHLRAFRVETVHVRAKTTPTATRAPLFRVHSPTPN